MRRLGLDFVGGQVSSAVDLGHAPALLEPLDELLQLVPVASVGLERGGEFPQAHRLPRRPQRPQHIRFSELLALPRRPRPL